MALALKIANARRSLGSESDFKAPNKSAGTIAIHLLWLCCLLDDSLVNNPSKVAEGRTSSNVGCRREVVVFPEDG